LIAVTSSAAMGGAIADDKAKADNKVTALGPFLHHVG
jgi:hypothetical protein